jgi:hypothetical protein
MADSLTLTDLLMSQTERKLTRMREAIVAERDRLGTELKLVDEALARKQRGKQPRTDEQRKPKPSNGGAAKSPADGRFEGLSRDALYEYVAEYGQPVKAPEMRDYLATKGIVRNVEAVRVALVRLTRDKRLTRYPDGRFAVPNGNGASPHSGRPASSGELPGFEAVGLPDPAGGAD